MSAVRPLTLAYALGTWTWQSATSTIDAQSTPELFLALALGALVKLSDPSIQVAERAEPRYLFAAGLSGGLVVAARPQVLLLVGVLGFFLWLRWAGRRGVWRWAIARFLIPRLLLAAYQTCAFGVPWRSGYGV